MTKEVLSAIQDAVGTQVFGIWFLIGAALVFFMQAGFAMVETGFTRAKNAGNIIMASDGAARLTRKQELRRWKVAISCSLRRRGWRRTGDDRFSLN